MNAEETFEKLYEVARKFIIEELKKTLNFSHKPLRQLSEEEKFEKQVKTEMIMRSAMRLRELKTLMEELIEIRDRSTIQKGRIEGILIAAKNLLRKGKTLEEVISLLDLPDEVVERLREEEKAKLQ